MPNAKVPSWNGSVAADQQIDLAALAERAKATNAGAVYVCNPNNPTGLLLDALDLRAFCVEVAKARPVIVDEAYIEISPAPVRNSMMDLVRAGARRDRRPHLSKVYGLAALRVGFIAARPDRVRTLKSMIPTHKGRPRPGGGGGLLRRPGLSGRREKLPRDLPQEDLCDLRGQRPEVTRLRTAPTSSWTAASRTWPSRRPWPAWGSRCGCSTAQPTRPGSASAPPPRPSWTTSPPYCRRR
ncbi:aminotransferase class I/II-fold pyridoxal phosphate-dependent enzyme [Caulobacter segnis]